MLPPEKENGYKLKNVKNFFVNILKRFYSDDMLGKHFNVTIESMLFEIKEMNQDDDRLRKFENSYKYLESTYDSIDKCFRKQYQEEKIRVKT